MKKIFLVAALFFIFTAEAFSKNREQNVSFTLKPYFLDSLLGYERLLQTNKTGNAEKDAVFTNYVGYRVGAGVEPITSKPFIIDLSFVEKMMFNKRNGLIFDIMFQTNFFWFTIGADVKYIHKFNKHWGITLGVNSPVKYAKVFSWAEDEIKIQDILAIIIGVSNIFEIGVSYEI